jgi:hypothetical protein
VQLVATNGAGTTFGADQTFMTKADPAPSAPALGKSFNLLPVSGQVYIKVPGSNSSSLLSSTGPGFVPLTEARSLPAGSQIDSRYGTFKLTNASGKKGRLSSGTFGGAIVTVSQAKNGRDKGLTTFRLLLGAFPGAPNLKGCSTNKTSRGPASGGPLARIASIPFTYHSRSHGRYRTLYGRASGSSSGARWDTSVGCGGVMFKVFRGSILVNVSHRHKTLVVHAGQHYLARAG